MGGKALGLKEFVVVRVSVSSSSISVTINSNHSKHMLNCVDNPLKIEKLYGVRESMYL